MKKNYLIIPIYELYHIDSLAEVKFNNHVAEYVKDQRSITDRREIYSALKWAVENPGFNYIALMKEAPGHGTLKFSNAEIHQYVLNFKSFMEDGKYGLLTDVRPPKKLPHEQ